MRTRRDRAGRYLVGGWIALIVLALTAVPALAAVETFAQIELHFGPGCHGSGFVEYPTIAQAFPPHRQPITWKPGTTFAHDFTTGLFLADRLSVAIVDRSGARLWGTSVPSSPPPDASGSDFTVKAWFDCSSGTLREVAAPDTATVDTGAPGRGDAPGRSAARSEGGGPVAFLALAFAAAALVCLQRFGQARRRSR